MFGRPRAAIIEVGPTLSARKLRMLVRPGGASARFSAKLPYSPTNSRFCAGVIDLKFVVFPGGQPGFAAFEAEHVGKLAKRADAGFAGDLPDQAGAVRGSLGGMGEGGGLVGHPTFPMAIVSELETDR